MSQQRTINADANYASYFKALDLNVEKLADTDRSDALAFDELIRTIRPDVLLRSVSASLKGILPDVVAAANDSPIDLAHYLDRLCEQIDEVAEMSQCGMEDVVMRGTTVDAVSGQVGAGTGVASGANPTSAGSGGSTAAAMGIYLVWKDLNQAYWPDFLKPIPIAIKAILDLYFGQIEQHSRGAIKARVVFGIQEAVDLGQLTASAFHLVLPAFIIPIWGADPEYIENVDMKGRCFLLGVPVAGRPIIKPHPNLPGPTRPITSQSLLSSDGWRRFVDDIEGGIEQLGVQIAKDILVGIAKAVVQNAAKALSDALVSGRETDPLLERLRPDALLDHPHVGPAINGVIDTVDQALESIANAFDTIVTTLQSVVPPALMGLAGTAGNGLLGLVDSVIDRFIEIESGKLLSQWSDDWFKKNGPEQENDIYTGIGKGLFGLIDEAKNSGFVTVVDDPKAGPNNTNNYDKDLFIYQGSENITLKSVSEKSDYSENGIIKVEEGTIVVFKGINGDEIRQVQSVDAALEQITFASIPSLGGVGSGPLTLTRGTPVLVLRKGSEPLARPDPNHPNQPRLDANRITLTIALQMGIARAANWLEGEISDQIDDLFEDVIQAINEDNPRQFHERLSPEVESTGKDFLARLLGHPNFDEIKTERTRIFVRAIPHTSGASPAQVSVSGNQATWTLPGAQFTASDMGRVLRVRNASHSGNNGIFSITEIVDATTIKTSAAPIQNETFTAATGIQVFEIGDLNSPTLLRWTHAELEEMAIEGIEDYFKEFVEDKIEDILDDISLTQNGVKYKAFMAQIQQHGSTQTVDDAIRSAVSQISSRIVEDMGVSQLFRVDQALTRFANNVSNKTVRDENGQEVRDENGQVISNADFLDLEKIATDIVTSAAQQVIGKAFIVSVVCGFELTGGDNKEGGGVLADWSMNLFLFNNIEGNVAQGSGEGGGMMVKGYLPNILIGNTLVNNRAQDSGGGLCLHRTSLVLAIANEFNENHSPKGGGIECQKGSMGLFAWNDIEDNTAANGAGIYLDSDPIIFFANTIKNNTATELGGGLLARRGGILWLNEFKNNVAERGGGLACIHRCRLDTWANYIKANHATVHGGGIAIIGRGSRPGFGSDRIANNTAPKGAGCYADAHCRPSLSGLRFVKNMADEEGGGLYVERGGQWFPTVAGVNFYGNGALRGAGAWTGRSAGFIGCSFAGNDANQGGGLYAKAIAGLGLDGCDWILNTSGAEGAGAYLQNISHVEVFSNLFDKNRAFNGDGAGLFGSALTRIGMRMCVLQENYVHNHNGGGAALVHCEKVHVYQSEIVGNGTEMSRGDTAGTTQCIGGGLYFAYCDDTLINSNLFDKNGAERGGGIGLVNDTTVLITRNRFTRNTADLNMDGEGYGGAIFATGQNATVTIGGDTRQQLGCRFTQNTAGTPEANRINALTNAFACGGAIAIDNGPTAIIHGCQFKRNAATDIGGGIFLRDHGSGSLIGGENRNHPTVDRPADGQWWGNVADENCLVIQETAYPWEPNRIEFEEERFLPPPPPGLGVRQINWSTINAAGLGPQTQLAQNQGPPDLTVALNKVLDEPLNSIWPAPRDTTSDWNAPAPSTSLTPPWPPNAEWMPSNLIGWNGFEYEDAEATIHWQMISDPVRQIVTRRGGFFGVVRGADLKVFGNWIGRNYATQMGGGGYVEQSDQNCVIGRDLTGSEEKTNLFRDNLSTLGGGLALVEATRAITQCNEFGGSLSEANHASAGGGIAVVNASPHVTKNTVIGNLAGDIIADKDAAFFPTEMTQWVQKGLLAFGGGILVAGFGKSKVEDNVVRENLVRGMPDYNGFVSPATPTPVSTGASSVATVPTITPAVPSTVLHAPFLPGRFSTASVAAALRFNPGHVVIRRQPSSAPSLTLPSGEYLFGAGVALLESGSVTVSRNLISDNEILVNPAKVDQPQNWHLVGAGLAALLADPGMGISTLYANQVKQNKIRMPHKGIDKQIHVTCSGAGMGIFASSNIKIQKCAVLDNVAEHELPVAGASTPELNGQLRGGGIALRESLGIAIELSLVQKNALYGLDSTLSAFGGAIDLKQTDVTLHKNLITDNFSHLHGGGLAIEGGEVAMTHQTIAYNEALSAGPVMYLDGDLNTSKFHKNIFMSFPTWTSAGCFGGSALLSPIISDNVFYNPTGKAAGGTLPNPLSTPLNKHGHPLFAEPEKFDYALSTGSAARSTLAGGEDYGWAPRTSSIVRESTVINVPNDFATIQAAIDAATDDDVVTVSPGQYKELITMKDGVVLQSTHGPEQTIIEPPDMAPDDSILLQANAEKRGTVVSGFTFRGVHYDPPPPPPAIPPPLTLSKHHGLLVNGDFRGRVQSNVIHNVKTGLVFQPVGTSVAVPERGDRAQVCNNTFDTCHEKAVLLRADRRQTKVDPVSDPCRGKVDALVRVHLSEFRVAAITHNIFTESGIGVEAQHPTGSQQEPVSSRYLFRNDFFNVGPGTVGYVSDVVVPGLNDNLVDDPALYRDPNEDDVSPISSPQSRIMGHHYDDQRTLGALEPVTLPVIVATGVPVVPAVP